MTLSTFVRMVFYGASFRHLALADVKSFTPSMRFLERTLLVSYAPFLSVVAGKKFRIVDLGEFSFRTKADLSRGGAAMLRSRESMAKGEPVVRLRKWNLEI